MRKNKRMYSDVEGLEFQDCKIKAFVCGSDSFNLR